MTSKTILIGKNNQINMDATKIIYTMSRQGYKQEDEKRQKKIGTQVFMNTAAQLVRTTPR